MRDLADKEKIQIIPIFYKVNAKDVAEQTGELGENFWNLAKKSSGDQIKKWKESLECISDKMGLSLGDESSEADFVKDIITEVKRVIATIRHDKKRINLGKEPERIANAIPLAFPFSRRAKPKSCDLILLVSAILS